MRVAASLFSIWRTAERLLRAWVLLLLLTGAAFQPGFAQDDSAAVLERRVKAALLYRFINYVEWPDSSFGGPGSPFVIVIAGADALAAELTEFAPGRRVLNRPLLVRRLRSAESLKDVHMIFIGRDESALLSSIARAAPQNVLIVTEAPDSLRQGSIINFVVYDGQVRFEISLEAAQRRNIRLSSRLLSVAHYIQTGTP